MVFGGVDRERIQLNEESMWAGPPVSENPDDLAGSLAEARELFFAGKPVEGERVVAKRMSVIFSSTSGLACIGPWTALGARYMKNGLS